MEHPKLIWLKSKGDGKCDDSLNHAAIATYCNLKEKKKWHEVELYFDENLKRPYLVVKFAEESLNRVILPMFSEEEMSPEDMLSVFHTIQPPGDPDLYDDGLILALVSSDQNIVYHNLSPGLVPPTNKPTPSSIPKSRDQKRKLK
ncbi:uncharacterized protein LOC120345050 [Styela clava]